MTYIEEYYKWICDNPNKVCKKIKTIYEKLTKDISKKNKVSFFNKSIGEEETHTYIFDEYLAHRPINFAEKYCRHLNNTADTPLYRRPNTAEGVRLSEI